MLRRCGAVGRGRRDLLSHLFPGLTTSWVKGYLSGHRPRRSDLKYRCEKGHETNDWNDGFCEIDSYPLERVGVGGGASKPMRSREAAQEVGLCLLVMDASGSMNEPIFPEMGNTSKADLVAAAAAGGIWDLQGAIRNADAIIAIVLFGEQAEFMQLDGRNFILPVSEIITRFSSSGEFRKAISAAVSGFEHGGGTDLNSGLALAYRVFEDAKAGDLSAHGYRTPITLVQHTIPSPQGQITVPNLRVMMYSDGEHTAASPLSNPFLSDNLVMTAFFGKPEGKGVKQMRSLAGTCPVHKKEGYFPVHDFQRYKSTLRGLFRMASGHSGFCLHCLEEAQRSLGGEGRAKLEP